MRRNNWLRPSVLSLLICMSAVAAPVATQARAGETTRFVRFKVEGQAVYGVVEGDQVQQIQGNLFGKWARTSQVYDLQDIEILVPTEPTQVIAMAGNYLSHLSQGETTITITTVTQLIQSPNSPDTTTHSTTTTEVLRPNEVPEKLQTPQPFFKSPSCLTAHNTNIVIPAAAEAVHFEAELVIVIGKKAQNVSKQDVPDYVFGVTCGNDVSARVWQKNDVQWWRAKGADTFGPCGPYIVTGLDYDNLLGQLRLNGEVKQRESTKEMIHDVATIVSFISQHVTLHPGDLIYTGTSGKTSSIAAGDVVEVEFAGVGVLRNTVAAEVK